MQQDLLNFIKYCLGYVKLTRDRTFASQQKFSVNLPKEHFDLVGLLNGDTDGNLGEPVNLETFYAYDPKDVPVELEAQYEIEKEFANKIEDIYNKYRNDQFTKQVIFNFGYFEIELPIVNEDDLEVTDGNIDEKTETTKTKIDRYPLFSLPVRVEKDNKDGVGKYYIYSVDPEVQVNIAMLQDILGEDLHTQAILSLSEKFELLATYDINNNGLNLPSIKRYLNLESLLEIKLDGVVVTIPSDQKLVTCARILESGKNIIVEKPFVQTIREFDSLENLANQQNLIMYSALHARFASSLTNFVKNLNINEQGTFHLKHGQLEKIELRRFDPYVKNGIVTHAPEISSGLDSWPNIFSELDLYTSNYKISSVQGFDSTFYPEYPEVKARVESDIVGGTFTTYTDWTNNMDQKDTTLFFKNGVVKLDHTNQQVWEGENISDLRMTADYNNLGSRLEVEYVGICHELYKVLSKNMPDNRDLSRKLVIDVETLMNSLQINGVRNMNN